MCRRTPINATELKSLPYLTLTEPDLRGRVIDLPASKSISNRALMLNALSGNECQLQRLAICDDTHSMQAALCSESSCKDIGAAGTAMRFLTAYYAARPAQQAVVLTGSERMKHRPIALLVNALRQMGAEIDYLEAEGYPPLRIQGKNLQGGEIYIDGSVSSQYLSALLMVAPLCAQGLRMHIEGKLNSRPYIEMTLAMMKTFGVETLWQDNTIAVPAQRYCSPKTYVVEKDWSAASYWFEMVALSDDAQVLLKDVQANSIQGDARVLDLFEDLGVRAEFLPEGLLLRSASLQSDTQQTEMPQPHEMPLFEADLSQQPDLAQTFAVTCALQHRPFALHGLESLRIKETDRMAALMNELKKLGYVLQSEGDSLYWRGERSEPQEPISIATYEDHRMAMAFAPAVLTWQGKYPIRIEHPAVVSKSYPEFFAQFLDGKTII
ncbi:MAG: 3-phosphoshikimate 1-carboxyvinyltransferase [Bacteroidales bacterium]|nr:3-phosphoshikimate 1-carboxyvinyltransferase [Bacteroidales bacterium]